HHDNDECEGLCGHVGKFAYERSLSLSSEIITRSMALLAKRVQSVAGQRLIYNPLGWDRHSPYSDEIIPALGYAVVSADNALADVTLIETDSVITLRRDELSVSVDKNTGHILQLSSALCPDGMSVSLLDLTMIRNDKKIMPKLKHIEVDAGLIRIELDCDMS